MRAAIIENGGIRVAQVPDPRPKDKEILVRVRAAAMNAGDLAQRDGNYPAPRGWPQHIPGLEVAGEVVETGALTSRFSVGDRVMAVVGGGGQAELIAIPECLAMPAPQGLTWAQAGSIPEAFLTAHDALFSQCDLKAGERLLVQGGAGGVGIAAIELGLAAGAIVTTTVRGLVHRTTIAERGCKVIAPDEFEACGPYDVILELVGGVNMPGNIRALRDWGRISIIGVFDGASASIDIYDLARRYGRIHASWLRPRPEEQKAVAARKLEKLVPHFESGRIRTHVHATFGLEEVERAYADFPRAGKLGKIVITC